MPEVRQTVARLPVCVLPEAMLLLSGVIWCFGDQSQRPKEHGSLSELFHLLIQRCCLKQWMCSSYPFTLESQLSNLVLYRGGVRRSAVGQGLSRWTVQVVYILVVSKSATYRAYEYYRAPFTNKNKLTGNSVYFRNCTKQS